MSKFHDTALAREGRETIQTTNYDKRLITQTCPCNILQYFTAVKMIIFRYLFLIFFLFLLKT